MTTSKTTKKQAAGIAKKIMEARRPQEIIVQPKPEKGSKDVRK